MYFYEHIIFGPYQQCSFRTADMCKYTLTILADFFDHYYITKEAWGGKALSNWLPDPAYEEHEIYSFVKKNVPNNRRVFGY